MPSIIENLVADGYSKNSDLALSSLRIALEAYFSTYQTMQRMMGIFDVSNAYANEEINRNYGRRYEEAFAETIVHLQHFVELSLKEYLRKRHDLLAINFVDNDVILDKLIKGQPVSDEEFSKINTIEFSKTLSRICGLISKGRMNSDLQFIVDAQELLKQLNKLRNRIWHRGLFILRYPSLDILMGKHLLPFIIKLTSQAEFSGRESLWRYDELSSGIEPIELIIEECKKRVDDIDIKKLAFLKELARAAYKNPIKEDPWFGGFSNAVETNRSKRIAESERENGDVSSIGECPVCGVESLIVYDVIEDDAYYENDGTSNIAYRHTYKVKCMCCSFNVVDELKNPSEYGLPLPDYWIYETLNR